MMKYYCSVGVYYLGRSLEGLVVKEGKAEAVVTEGRRIHCDQVSCFLKISRCGSTGGSACLSCSD